MLVFRCRSPLVRVARLRRPDLIDLIEAAPVIIERFMLPRILSNTYIVAGQPKGPGVLIDSGAHEQAVLARVDELELQITHVLCTHHHADHTENNRLYQARFGCRIGGHESESEAIPGCDLTLSHDDEIEVGSLSIRVLHVPGHTAGQLTFVASDRSRPAAAFTGDTLFRRSVGGTRAPGHASFAELRHSILKILGKLPPETRVHPGHAEPTTITEEWHKNPFIRAWRGVDRPSPRPCQVAGQEAMLVVQARDYDGGTKCWVRFAGEMDEIVPGSKVTVDR